jgi:hypothetical protein
MSFLAVNNSDRAGSLYVGKSAVVLQEGESRVFSSVPEYWTKNIRVVKAKTSVKKAEKGSGEVVNG